ncbi:Adenylate and Guanylate cyclase catalytic domain protein [Caballeronia temeraria]|uniref:Adenylate and Guanylate cyclase catalytic domain protein n=1 Tax=Caballeronia temeraria TaxID=1777137 RepID=A0A157ZSM9_9BURK|nr:adenylate/guanylate cyclase domain-containing protein [Caballeronia temeraria]SAK48532.1 Adenylate and Guanylate cyclase catalytic domain protein [Caballeronia temeraria]
MDSELAGTANVLQRVVRTILFADLVESCRLAEADEAGTAARWRNLRAVIENCIVPRHNGRLIRTEGDGLMMLFEHALPAARCALDIQAACRSNAGARGEAEAAAEPLMLRQSLHETELFADERDVYGRGVNLAARLYNLAGPGEIVMSDCVHARLAGVFDACEEDLGECHLRHLAQPVHAYRLGGPGPRPVIPPNAPGAMVLRPSIAVIPFASRCLEANHDVLGDILADDIITGLSGSDELRVISRLSTAMLRERGASAAQAGALLDARYVLSGAYRTHGGKIVLTVELADTKLECVVWGETLTDSIDAVVAGESTLVAHIHTSVGTRIITHELERTRSHSLPTLESSTLLLSSIALMHRGVRDEFERAGQMLDVLAERARSQATPYAWLAKWHVLRFNRGWTSDRVGEAHSALACARRALDADSRSSMALAVEGFVRTNLLKQIDAGEDCYERALEANPNDSLAWLLKGTLHAFKGEGEEAVASTGHALALSPLDPLRSFYESLCATAALSARQYARVIELAEHSLRNGPNNTSTLRALAIAQAELGLVDDARLTIGKVLAIEPHLTVRSFLERSPSAAFETGRIWSDALRRAGLPLQ